MKLAVRPLVYQNYSIRVPLLIPAERLDNDVCDFSYTLDCSLIELILSHLIAANCAIFII